jgi:hypothetical protein
MTISAANSFNPGPTWSRHSQQGLRYKDQPVDGFTLSEPEVHPQLKGRVQVPGHSLSDPRHGQYPSSRYEIRVYTRGDNGQVSCLDFHQLVAACSQPFQPRLMFPIEMSEGQPGAPSNPIAPKDHALRIETMDMEVVPAREKFFGQLSEIGQVEQFTMMGLVPGDVDRANRSLRNQGYKNYDLHPSNSTGAWLEDYSEPLLGGGRVVPGRFGKEGKSLSTVLTETRAARFDSHGLSSDFSRQGSVESESLQGVGGAQGEMYGERVHQATSYIEGGNLLSGLRPDGTPYLLVGRDSLALTQEMVARKLGRPPSENEVRRTIAEDYGLAADQVIGVEQPGEFHIDMRMTPLAPGVIGLQDSVLAAALQERWIREESEPDFLEDVEPRLQRMRQDAEELSRYEALTRKDLEQSGFQVVPMAGAFRNLDYGKVDGANFFNARHGTNPAGEKYTIMMGGTSQEEAYMANFLLGHGHLDSDRLYFLDPEQTADTLNLNGGLKCLTKPRGSLASPSS